MEVDFSKIRDTFLAWCIISASTLKDKNIMNIWPDLHKKGGGLDVKFIINGVELPLEQAFEELHQQMERMVSEKAYELIKEKFADITNTVENLERKIKQMVKEKLGITIDDEW